MSRISLEELTRIGSEIESMPSEGRRDISNVEFAWLYVSGKPLHLLKRQTGELALLLMMDGNCVVFEDYSETSAIAHVHNHPSENMQPSLEDLNVLLRGAAQNKNLSFALIASTNSGIVTGFYELQYIGERANAAALLKGNLDIWRRHLISKYDVLEKNPELRAKMSIGDSIFSLQEYNTMVSEAMTSSSIVGTARPLNGYRFEPWRFVSNSHQA